MFRLGLGLGLALIASAAASAGEFNKTLSLGDAAPEWKDLEGADGKKHSLADLKAKDVVVVVFTCNSCPTAVDYEDRIIAFAKAHAAGDAAKVGVVAINVNLIKEDSMAEMKKRAEKKKLPYPYLHDPSQQIAKKFGAMYTPEFFVLNKERKVTYMGALDDNSKADKAKVNYLEAAVTATLAGKSVEKGETLAASGCRIRYNREMK